MSWLLGIAWGALVATPLVVHARRVAVSVRVETLRADAPRRRALLSTRLRLDRVGDIAVPRHVKGAVASVARVARSFASRRARRLSEAELSRELPVAIDLLGVAIDAGCTPYLAVQVGAQWAPTRCAAAFDRVLRACALGVGFESAFGDVVRDSPRLRSLAEALLASDRLGAPVGPQLARLAAEERAGLRRRAEAHARRVPVKLLFPLVFLVLPAFVLLTVVPGLVAGLSRI